MQSNSVNFESLIIKILLQVKKKLNKYKTDVDMKVNQAIVECTNLAFAARF
jgi:hypothetical protein